MIFDVRGRVSLSRNHFFCFGRNCLMLGGRNRRGLVPRDYSLIEGDVLFSRGNASRLRNGFLTNSQTCGYSWMKRFCI
uniref:Uncharacterized protein n=1 Tax=Anguilla anguilla TaxID=7936 RepID=A0A0E9QBA9_ANGAN